ncbi:MAG: Type 1 glutamine amidotransferase-like domain-containing protein [Caldilineaceae bacterium]|nr:Type 1 glutamine amidotransferase-like domain-containing protein [Caldilineaceae bacterium]MCB9156221.1 Type 1 glutamine amidotransferase-like domain-containing protein [Caldilineaceae bacterium]
MQLLLTSDFPSTANDVVAEQMRNLGARPRVAWIPPVTSEGKARFQAAQDTFRALGVADLEYCDIDQEADAAQLAQLDRYDALYLTGGNPLEFRSNMIKNGLMERIRQYVADGRLVIAASGGAMQFTRNVSLFRLVHNPVAAVLAAHNEYKALGMVDYELLPHLNKLPPPFLDKVQRYSASVPHDIVALADGAVLIHEVAGSYRWVGQAVRFRDGVQKPMENVAG